ncbi:uncharacterized protein BT62DRAFT_932119 [Guyanagaster necrorhizus]|uniref:Asl1-like glycosyl hydrolase catalytic domain-containing protein n=1 Tax=Guyanagaster necrorhizus TaxID=856835 RepID=A0A9P8AST4_9AGAR|nr:uncharacterized protein BT62DRAFT_932119 [Guyanagaster necrorhizus MCA 3950]KAG7446674.1 hypothetical protein BT62DRAFT_932119 [Guyanagaster necrorhizus MCA 3950]
MRVQTYGRHIECLPSQFEGIRLDSPVPSGSPSGKTWLEQFLTDRDGYIVDSILLHWYHINNAQFIFLSTSTRVTERHARISTMRINKICLVWADGRFAGRQCGGA